MSITGNGSLNPRVDVLSIGHGRLHSCCPIPVARTILVTYRIKSRITTEIRLLVRTTILTTVAEPYYGDCCCNLPECAPGNCRSNTQYPPAGCQSPPNIWASWHWGKLLGHGGPAVTLQVILMLLLNCSCTPSNSCFIFARNLPGCH